MAKSKLMCPILILGLIALAFQLAAVFYPGLVMLHRSDDAGLYRQMMPEASGFKGMDDMGMLPSPHPEGKPMMPGDDIKPSPEDRPMMPGGDMSPPPVAESRPVMPEDDAHPEPESESWSESESGSESEDSHMPPHHPHHRPHHHPHHRPHHHTSRPETGKNMDDLFEDGDMTQNMFKKSGDMQNWFANEMKSALTSSEAQKFKVSYSMNIGLFFSKFCIHQGAGDQMKGEKMEHKKNDDRSCKCGKTETILSNFGFFLDPASCKDDGKKDHMSITGSMSHSINAHRGLAFTAVILTLIGLICGILGFRKEEACRCFRVASMAAMLISTVLLAIPIGRIAHMNVYFHHHAQNGDARIAHPVSILFAGISLVLTLICCILALIGVVRKRSNGNWRLFSNETMSGKGTSSYSPNIYAEPLPEKATLEFSPAVCNTEIVPPYLTAEEKKPIE